MPGQGLLLRAVEAVVELTPQIAEGQLGTQKASIGDGTKSSTTVRPFERSGTPNLEI
jgi:hypothetical protein